MSLMLCYLFEMICRFIILLVIKENGKVDFMHLSNVVYLNNRIIQNGCYTKVNIKSQGIKVCSLYVLLCSFIFLYKSISCNMEFTYYLIKSLGLRILFSEAVKSNLLEQHGRPMTHASQCYWRKKHIALNACGWLKEPSKIRRLRRTILRLKATCILCKCIMHTYFLLTRNT